MSNNKVVGLHLVSILFAVAGIVISTMTIKEDVISTAKTVFEYFPLQYGVTPATTWAGALTLGIFISVFQVVAASVAFSKNFHVTNRIVASFALGMTLVFDNWTDVVFRSGYLSGNVEIAWITTIAFYTLGSEIMQGLSWLVLISTWRLAVSDFMWGLAKLSAGLNSIAVEWRSFHRAAQNKENKERFASFDRNQESSKTFQQPFRPNNAPKQTIQHNIGSKKPQAPFITRILEDEDRKRH